MLIDIDSLEMTAAEDAEYRALRATPDAISRRDRDRREYVSYMRKVFDVIEMSSVKIQNFAMKVIAFVRRSARSVRSAVRQTFAARKAAKSSDSGGDPDGRPRPAKSYTLKNPRNTQFSYAFSFGGAL